jgi:hypothetical protein
VLGPQGEDLSASSAEARTNPPVSSVGAEARLGNDLRVTVSWTLGGGTADRVRVVRTGPGGEAVLLDTRDLETIVSGSAADGPFVPAADGVEPEYRVEAWVGDSEGPAAQGTAVAQVPPVVERVSAVVQSVDRGSVLVQWETFPREAIAEGYAVYRQRGEDGDGELVARVGDPFAREYEYAVEDPLKASGWRHMVVPYVGARYIMDPDGLTVQSQGAEESLERRAQRGVKLPNLTVSWAPYAGARAYVARSPDGKEFSLKRNYMEIHGIQNPLMGAAQQMKVSAVDREGNLVELVTVEIRFEHYPRSASPRGEGQ